MEKKTRGQASIEFLMTYGWAIVVMSIVLVALWVMGVFKPPTSPPGCSGFSQIRILDQKATQTGDIFEITMLNDAGMKLQVIEINASIYGDECDSLTGLATDLRAGQTNQTQITCTNLVPEEGDYYKFDLTISYTNPVSGIRHNSVGECHGTVEP